VNPETVTNERLTRFLLRDLSREDQESLEISLLEEEPFERLSGVEIELIEKYLSKQLSNRDEKLFEQNYLSTQHGREQIQAVKAVASYLDTLPDPSPLRATPERLSIPSVPARQTKRHFILPQWGWAALVGALLVSFTIYFVKRERALTRLHQELEASHKKQEDDLRQLKQNNDALTRELEQRTAEKHSLENKLAEETAGLDNERRQKQERPGAGPVYSAKTEGPPHDLFYESAGRGSSESVDIKPNAGVRFVNFRLHFPPDSLTVLSSARIEQVGGSTIWHAPKKTLRLRRSGSHLMTGVQRVPIEHLSTGNYLFILTGKDKQNKSKSISYQFAIIRQ